MWESVELHNRDMKIERRRLQSRMFAGIFSTISLVVLFFGIWDEHIELTVVSGVMLVVTTLIFWRK